MDDISKIELVDRKCKRKRCVSHFKVMKNSKQLYCSIPCRESSGEVKMRFGRDTVKKEDDENEND